MPERGSEIMAALERILFEMQSLLKMPEIATSYWRVLTKKFAARCLESNFEISKDAKRESVVKECRKWTVSESEIRTNQIRRTNRRARKFLRSAALSAARSKACVQTPESGLPLKFKTFESKAFELPLCKSVLSTWRKPYVLLLLIRLDFKV